MGFVQLYDVHMGNVLGPGRTTHTGKQYIWMDRGFTIIKYRAAKKSVNRLPKCALKYFKFVNV
jgi:hypothetical protein